MSQKLVKRKQSIVYVSLVFDTFPAHLVPKHACLVP